jgi:hypothetical protein
MVELDQPSNHLTISGRGREARRMGRQRNKKGAPSKAERGRPQKRGPRGTGRWGRITSTSLRILAVPLVVMAFPLAIAAAFLAMSLLGQSSEPEELKAAIVDQLALTEPNPSFSETATELLQGVGYTVDYYPGEQVTVDFYRNLPEHGYDLIVLRNHSARRPDVLASRLPDEAALFTSEDYNSDEYVDDQNALRLVKVRYLDSEEVFFGVRSDFITSSMKGRFDGTTIVLMGCNGLTTTRTAAAFIEKGARAVVGWSDLVSAGHTDEATERLVQHLVVDRLTLGEAVQRTNAEVGPDPAYGSVLRVYPESAAVETVR